MKVTVDSKYKLWECAAPNDARPILQGVFVDPLGLMVVADGFCMAVVPCKIEDAPSDFKGVTIPAVIMKQATGGIEKELTIDLEVQTVSTPVKYGTLTSRLIQGNYPKWKHLAGKPEPATPFNDNGFDPKIALRLCKALDIRFLHAWQASPTSPGIVLAKDGAWGVIMPAILQNYSQADLQKVWILSEAL